MTVHLIKMAVGVENPAHLVELQARRLSEARSRGESPLLRHLTRNTPRQRPELLRGGSLYWVIKGFIRLRQTLAGIEPAVNANGRPSCALILDHRLVATEPRSRRPFQGWRYLRAEDAPGDAEISGAGAGAMPAEMADELRLLGLL